MYETKQLKRWLTSLMLLVILQNMTVCAQGRLDCKPPSYCYTHVMDSMAIEAKLFMDEFCVVVETYKSDSVSFTNQIKNDSIYKLDQSARILKANNKIDRIKKFGKIKTTAFSIGGGFVGWFIRKFIFG